MLNIDFNQIKLIPAEKDNEIHKKGILKVFNENINNFHLTSEPVSYENHYKWWDRNFEKEFIYVIIHNSEICGYIRLTKNRTNTKEKHEISIAILKKYQKLGIGTFAYKLFEKKMKKIGINEIIVNNQIENETGQRFFENLEFKKSLIKYIKKF